jgi:two-component sensor histidine kinase
VLEVDSRSEGEFSEQDIAFLQGAANVLAMAIERQRYERRLQEALEFQKTFVQEINHRVKNSLQLVASMFSLQASSSNNPALAQSLHEATSRVTAIARIHERLYRNSEMRTVDLAAYVEDICSDLAGLMPDSELKYERGEPVRISTDRAVRVALVVTELITNAAKHGYPNEPGRILVTLALRGPNSATITVRDWGIGMSSDSSAGNTRGLGTKLIRALVSQLGGNATVSAHDPGTEISLDVPLEARAEVVPS